jgi:capsular polysaccharide biosynthesis protein
MDFEFLPLKEQINYESLDCYDHGKNTIYEFNNVVFNEGKGKEEIFDENYILVAPTGHYFHFLKESFGSYLYYKEHIDKNIKVLWTHLNFDHLPNFHKIDSVLEYLFKRIKHDNPELLFINELELWQRTLRFKKIVIIYDGGRILVNQSFPLFEQKINANNKVIRSFFKDLMIDDKTKPKKIYISRRLVSQELKANNDLSSISRYNPEWLEDAVEDYFKNNGYEIIELSNMSIQDQISYFYNAHYIAGQMGAGLINGIFSKNNTKFVCVNIHKWFHYPYDEDIFQVIKAKYDYVYLYDTQSYEEAYEVLSLRGKEIML